jgi:putative membrane protein
MENIDKKEFVEVVKIQEYKLYKYIGVPAMWATVLSGLLMIYLNDAILSSGGWMHAKITVVILLIAYSHSLGKIRKVLEKDKCTKSGKFFRFYNEVPTILSLLIVIFVIVKPF